jgi:hypothetical protein
VQLLVAKLANVPNKTLLICSQDDGKTSYVGLEKGHNVPHLTIKSFTFLNYRTSCIFRDKSAFLISTKLLLHVDGLDLSFNFGS